MDSDRGRFKWNQQEQEKRWTSERESPDRVNKFGLRNSLNRGLRGYAPIPITFRLIINDTPAVKASAIQNAFQTPTAPKK